MIKKLGLTTIALSTLLLTGCGGSGDTSGATNTNNKFSGSQRDNAISNKKYVAIIKNVPSDICELSVFRNKLSQTYTDIVTAEKSNNTTCRDYGKRRDGIECAVSYYTGTAPGHVACVVGSNGKKGNYKQSKIVEKSSFIVGESSFMDIIDTTFIQVAE